MLPLRRLGGLLLCLTLPAMQAQADLDGRWRVAAGSAKYEVRHVMHGALGSSDDVQGEMTCRAQRCRFRLFVSLDTFRSGDAERDEDLLGVMRAAEHPLAVVEGTGRRLAAGEAVIVPTVQLGGGRATLPPVRVTLDEGWWQLEVRGRLALSLTALGIERPTLLGLPIADEVLIYVELRLEQD